MNSGSINYFLTTRHLRKYVVSVYVIVENSRALDNIVNQTYALTNERITIVVCCLTESMEQGETFGQNAPHFSSFCLKLCKKVLM